MVRVDSSGRRCVSQNEEQERLDEVERCPRSDARKLDVNIQELLDREAIRDVLATYCRAVDRHDETLMRSVYHPGAHESHGTFVGSAEDFVTSVISGKRYVGGQHVLGSSVIELNGDSARVESTFICHLVTSDQHDGRVIDVIAGRYWDTFERRDGHWKIAGRTVLLDWHERRPHARELPFSSEFIAGRRDELDATYA